MFGSLLFLLQGEVDLVTDPASAYTGGQIGVMLRNIIPVPPNEPTAGAHIGHWSAQFHPAAAPTAVPMECLICHPPDGGTVGGRCQLFLAGFSSRRGNVFPDGHLLKVGYNEFLLVYKGLHCPTIGNVVHHNIT